ncbi:hypothetical protein ACP70R_019849 [Stipagrostis hirtigluma subsp. patula]
MAGYYPRRGGEEAAHAVCLPYPARGHITPDAHRGQLHGRGLDITFVNTEYNHARLVRTRGAAAVAGAPGSQLFTANLLLGTNSVQSGNQPASASTPTS